MTIRISALPNAGPLTGTEDVPAVQGGVTVRFPSAALVGPAGPKGGTDLSIVEVTGPATYNVLATDDVVLAYDTGGTFTVQLPAAATFPSKPFVLKFFGAAGVFVNFFALAPDTIDGNAFIVVPGSASFTQFTTYVVYPFNSAIFGSWVWLVLAYHPAA